MRQAHRRILIDTDAGVDDALAIIYAMHSPEVRIEVITTVAGNVEVDKCTRNVKTILQYCHSGYSPDVVEGSREPLRLPLTTAPEVHGKDGLGNTLQGMSIHPGSRARGAVERIRRACDQFADQLTIVALGPLTNIALAFRKYPGSIRKAHRIVSMGGAFRVPGNTGPVAEFNYFVDPDAADLVLKSKLPLRIVPLDVTEQIVFLRKDLQQIVSRRQTPLSSFIYRFTSSYMHYHKKTLGFLGGYLHDPLAVAIAITPSLAKTQRIHVDVECESVLTRGMTVADFRKKGKRTDPEVVIGFDQEKFLRMFHRRLLAY